MKAMISVKEEFAIELPKLSEVDREIEKKIKNKIKRNK